ncbi:outer membrane beta-barrel protein [Frateuria defendens]|uniref:outer membrane beta-barrel protein n=1 Tax=Frateuria defendens TaxID=2219559 RepID=UPI00066FBB2B|nr:outer membrane beta-barrel protein [Frateuria defendens]
MNKFVLSAALAGLALSPLLTQTARADSSNQLDNFYVAGNLGQTQYRDSLSHDHSVFQNVRFGWRWNGIVGPEIGYAYLGRPKDVIGNDRFSVKPRAATVGVNAKYDFYQNWFVTGHAGYMRSRSNLKATVDGVTDSSKSWNNGWYGGVGVGYNLTPSVSLGLNYDNYHLKVGRGSQSSANVAAYSASVEYRF